MSAADLKLLIISHAGIKQINRAVYRHLRITFPKLQVVIPESLLLSSGKKISVEQALSDDPSLIPLELKGRNPRTYMYPALISVLDRIKPDVVLLENDPVSRLGYSIARWCSTHNAALVCQSYENVNRGVTASFRHRGLMGILKNMPVHILNFFMAKRVQALFIVNRESEKIFSNYHYPRISRMPLGYDKRIFFVDEVSRAAYRKKLHIPDQELLIAYFGRLVEQKGVHLLIEALSAMKDKSWKLLLDHIHDSSGTYSQRIQNLIVQHDLQEKVLYFEADHFEIANYMRAADIMVAPSITTRDFMEQYGRAIQEAMACGCVSIVSDSGHLQDLVGDRSLVFQQNNVAALKDCLQSLMSNTHARRVYSQSLALRASEKFTTEKQAEVQTHVIQTLSEQKRI